jgi:DNA invertase Pin-like site-specific DNA recombinase
MTLDTHNKITASHLKRGAYLYIRQATLRQVLEHGESTKRQYALRQRALDLGWTPEQISVIDTDLGQSGASAADREGFQKLVAEVSMGRAGIVLGLEVSRLARNSTDWHRLLEICAFSDTLILDEDGIYNPCLFNDRLLLGLKGTMSEAELHVMRARLQGGLLAKAKRGQLMTPLPIGLTYDDQLQVILDPDQQIQQSLQLVFSTFRRTGSAFAVVKHFRQEQLLFPHRPPAGPRSGEVCWEALSRTQVIRILRNPRYAGAYFYGRTRSKRRMEGGRKLRPVDQEHWYAFLKNAHPAYIAWEDFEENQRQLDINAKKVFPSHAPPREGPALLQGLAICGLCGKRMGIQYHQRGDHLVPDYRCDYKAIQRLEKPCQYIPGEGIDAAISDLLLEAVTPVALEVALRVQEELQSRLEEASRLRQAQVDRAEYEANLAKRRYMQVDPDNRLVADTLEREWNTKLRNLEEAKLECERRQADDMRFIDPQQRSAIMALATDFPNLWRNPNIPHRERKRMVRLLLEDVTVIKRDQITLHIRFKGGAEKTMVIPVAPNAWKKYMTSPEVVSKIDQMLDQYTEQEIASLLNQQSFRSGRRKPFTTELVQGIRQRYCLKTRYDRLRDTGLLTIPEVTELFGISAVTVYIWHRLGLLKAHSYDGRAYLFERPATDSPLYNRGKTFHRPKQRPTENAIPLMEVQYET